jgi:hypothetical protein
MVTPEKPGVASSPAERAVSLPFPQQSRTEAPVSPPPAQPVNWAQPVAPPDAAPPRRSYWYEHPFWRAVAIIVALAMIGLLVWLLLSRNGGAPNNDGAPRVEMGGSPVILAPAQLAAFSTDLREPIYWAGETPGTRLEFAETTTRLLFVRYLSGNVPAGDPSAQFLTIGTYPVPNGYADLRAWARQEHATVRQVPSGGIAVRVPRSPTSVFFAEPSKDVQVEVYDPRPRHALHVVMSGSVRPIGPGVRG